jgi:glycosyltransferase involved in cell wall biosynthesis
MSCFPSYHNKPVRGVGRPDLYPMTDGITAWVFFAAGATTSMRRAIAERLAETEPVIIVDRPVNVLRERIIPPLRLRLEPMQQGKQSWCYRPLYFPTRVPAAGRAFKAWNRCLLASELARLLPSSARKVMCFDSPTQDHLVGRLGEDLSIYLAVDDRTITVWGAPIEGELEAERRLLQKVDQVICVSEPLARSLQERINGGHAPSIEVITNGYDERRFDPDKTWVEPRVLRGIPSPRILVAGHVSERIDWQGIASACRIRPGWRWVFVGPADPHMPEKIGALAAQVPAENGSSAAPGMIWIDRVPVEEVPALIAHSDACAVPYRLNPFSLASSPLKAIEYLAMGAPVLSTRIPSLRCYDGAIRWVNEGDGQSYASALDSLLSRQHNQQDITERHACVRSDSWAQKSRQFRKLALDLQARKGR